MGKKSPFHSVAVGAGQATITWLVLKRFVPGKKLFIDGKLEMDQIVYLHF